MRTADQPAIGGGLTEAVDFLIGNPSFSVRRMQAWMGLPDFKTTQRYLGVPGRLASCVK